MSFPSRSAILFALLSATAHSLLAENEPSVSTGFTLHQIPNSRFVANGTKHLLATHARYQSYSKSVSTESATTPDDVVTTPAPGDSEYVVTITVAGQKLVVNIDTGSADLWVCTPALPSDEQVGHTCFDPNKTTDSTFSMLPSSYTWAIKYGDGSTSSGTVGLGVVNIGGAIVSNQAIELATVESEDLADNTYINGIVGFAFSSINTVQPQQQNTWFENIKGNLPLPVFTANLKHNAPGYYDFGFIDQTKFVGSLAWQDVDTSWGFWMFDVDGYGIGTGKTVLPTGGLYPAIVDTGSSLLIMEEDLVQAYYAKVAGSEYSQTYGAYIFPCASTLPSLTLQMGNYSAVISGSSLVYGQVSQYNCYGALQIGPDGLNVLGDIFLKSQFVVFDGGIDGPNNFRVGLAAKSSSA